MHIPLWTRLCLDMYVYASLYKSYICLEVVLFCWKLNFNDFCVLFIKEFHIELISYSHDFVFHIILIYSHHSCLLMILCSWVLYVLYRPLSIWWSCDFHVSWNIFLFYSLCWHLKKTRFLLVRTMSKLVDIYKRQVTDELTTSFHPSPRDKEATWTPLIQQADNEPGLPLNRPQQV